MLAVPKGFAADDLLAYDGQAVCAQCKPLFLQRLREGAGSTGLRYAGFWIRFVAVLIDGVIISIVNLLVGLIPTLALIEPSGGTGPLFIIGTVLSVVLQYGVLIGYETYMIGRHGATLGKMAMKIRVVMPDGGKVSYLRAFARYFAKILSSVILLIGYILAAFDSQKRALHDSICNTRVVYK